MKDKINLLTIKNFELYAAKAYRNPQCLSYEEFKLDLDTARVINRMMTTDSNNIRLLVNLVVKFYNVFDTRMANNMLFFRCQKENYTKLITILEFLNYLPEDSDLRIFVDQDFLKVLEEL